MSQGVWGEEGEAGMGSQRCEQGLSSAHRPWTAGEESVSGWGGRALTSASGPQQELAL